MRWLKPGALLVCFSAFYSQAQQPLPLLLTGKIGSAEKQIVTAPKSNRWQIQIQWLEEEGKVVNKGDLIAVFDGSLIQSQLEVNIERLETVSLELIQTRMELQQQQVEAQGELEVAKLRVQKAEIEAAVPDGQVSNFDKGQFELNFKRSLMEQVKAQQKLALAQEALNTGVEKRQIEIRKIEEEIAFQKRQLDTMSVVAQYSGPITYANHPWSGDKLAAGINVQAAWNIVTVQATNSFQIETWVHEIDVDDVKQHHRVELVLDAYPGKTFTGRLESISTQSEKQPQWSSSVYYPIVYTFEQEPQVTLLPGMSVRLSMLAPVNKDNGDD